MSNLKIDLSDKQVEAYTFLTDKTTRALFFGGGAGGGKSWLGCTWLFTHAITFPETRWLMGRKEFKRLRETTLKTFWKVIRYYGKVSGIDFKNDFKYNINQGLIVYKPNGSEIMLSELAEKPSDPDFDDLGSLELTGAFVDESPEIAKRAFDVLSTRVGRQNNKEYKLLGKIFLTGNPTKNWVYHEFYKKYREGKLGKDYAFLQSLVTDNPYIPPEYITALNNIKDRILKERLLFGNWDYIDDPTVLIDYSKISDLFTNEYVPNGRRYITCDVARTGRDKSVMMVWNGWRMEDMHTINRGKLDDVKKNIERLRRKHGVPLSNILIDGDGVGGGVVDFGGYREFNNGARPMPVNGKRENYNHLKSQCYFHLAEKINDGKVFINANRITDVDKDRIMDELSIVKRDNADTDGKIKIIPKEMMKELNNGKSPDYADCIMMRVFFDLTFSGYLI